MYKRFLILGSIITGSMAIAQVRTTGNVNTIGAGSSSFIDASSNAAWNTDTGNVGKGLVFPRTDLVKLTQLVSATPANTSNFPTRMDGMIVYNTATGTSGIGKVAVKPGFYYYENKGATLNSGTWKPIGGDASSALPTTATNGQVLKWNGSAWTAQADNNTTYTAGTGIEIAGSNNTIAIKTTVKDVSADYTLTNADNNGYVYVNAAGATTITVPSSLPAGFSCIIVQQGAGQVTIAGGTGVTIQSARGTKTRKQYSAVGIIKRVAGEATITGDAVE